MATDSMCNEFTYENCIVTFLNLQCNLSFHRPKHKYIYLTIVAKCFTIFEFQIPFKTFVIC